MVMATANKVVPPSESGGNSTSAVLTTIMTNVIHMGTNTRVRGLNLCWYITDINKPNVELLLFVIVTSSRVCEATRQAVDPMSVPQIVCDAKIVFECTNKFGVTETIMEIRFTYNL
jgi:hypothetical protein